MFNLFKKSSPSDPVEPPVFDITTDQVTHLVRLTSPHLFLSSEPMAWLGLSDGPVRELTCSTSLDHNKVVLTGVDGSGTSFKRSKACELLIFQDERKNTTIHLKALAQGRIACELNGEAFTYESVTEALTAIPAYFNMNGISFGQITNVFTSREFERVSGIRKWALTRRPMVLDLDVDDLLSTSMVFFECVEKECLCVDVDWVDRAGHLRSQQLVCSPLYTSVNRFIKTDGMTRKATLLTLYVNVVHDDRVKLSLSPQGDGEPAYYWGVASSELFVYDTSLLEGLMDIDDDVTLHSGLYPNNHPVTDAFFQDPEMLSWAMAQYTSWAFKVLSDHFGIHTGHLLSQMVNYAAEARHVTGMTFGLTRLTPEIYGSNTFVRVFTDPCCHPYRVVGVRLNDGSTIEVRCDSESPAAVCVFDYTNGVQVYYVTDEQTVYEVFDSPSSHTPLEQHHERFKLSEAYGRDFDAFIRYVLEKGNPSEQTYL